MEVRFDIDRTLQQTDAMASVSCDAHHSMSDHASFGACPLMLEDYFSGSSRARGVFLDRFGTLRRQFEADIQGTWDGRVLTLDEEFAFDDGERERRVWRIEKLGEQRYRGHTEDMIGIAEGTVSDNCLRWAYGFKIRVGERMWAVRFDDQYFLQGGNTLINRAAVSKFGIGIGELIMVFQKS